MNGSTENFYWFLDGITECAGDVLLKSHSREEFCSKQGAEMWSIANAGICGYSLL